MGLVIYMENETMIEQTIYNMLTENTGTHMLDSGGGSGRHWQRNQKKSIEDFRKSYLKEKNTANARNPRL